MYLAPDDKGTFLVTCKDLPDLVSFGKNEEEALQMAKEAILEMLSSRRGSSDFPY